MASTTVNFASISDRVSAATASVREAIEGTQDPDDLKMFVSHADRLIWIAELAEISVDGIVTLDSADMEAIWHWTVTAEDNQE